MRSISVIREMHPHQVRSGITARVLIIATVIKMDITQCTGSQFDRLGRLGSVHVKRTLLRVEVPGYYPFQGVPPGPAEG